MQTIKSFRVPFFSLNLLFFLDDDQRSNFVSFSILISKMGKIATFVTSMGTFKAELHTDRMPITCGNFIDLASTSHKVSPRQCCEISHRSSKCSVRFANSLMRFWLLPLCLALQTMVFTTESIFTGSFPIL